MSDVRDTAQRTQRLNTLTKLSTQLDSSPSSLYALASACFSTIQSLLFLAFPATVLSILEPVAKDDLHGPTAAWLLRALGMLLLALAFPQYQLARGALDPAEAEAEHFYAWAATLVAQIATFALAYVRYTAARAAAPALGFDGGVAWSVLMGGAAGLAVWGVWCLLFAQGPAGAPRGKVRSSGWLFPSREKRRAKVERRERRYGTGAAVK